MKYLWSHRDFVMFHGWQPWYTRREVDVVAITPLYYKIAYKLFGVFNIYEWIPKDSNADIIEQINHTPGGVQIKNEKEK